MPDFGIFRGFNEKLFGDKLYAGQLPINLGLIGSENITPFLLDLYPNAAAAYSLRKLRSGYTGGAIRVRRTDLQESDIGFTSTGNLDTTALLAFTGTGALDNGFVTTWYDQSGNSTNALQTTALKQPQIVSSGSVILENAKPAIFWDKVNDVMSASVTNNAQAGMAIAVIKGLSGAEIALQSTIASSRAAQQHLIRSSSSKFRGLIDPPLVFYDGNTTLDETQKLIMHYSNGVKTEISINEFSQNLTYGSSSNLGQWSADNTGGVFDLLNIGANLNLSGNFVEYFGGNIQEIIIYTSDQSSNQTQIRTNINDFYSIY
jgi:hypothetical protein